MRGMIPKRHRHGQRVMLCGAFLRGEYEPVHKQLGGIIVDVDVDGCYPFDGLAHGERRSL